MKGSWLCSVLLLGPIGVSRSQAADLTPPAAAARQTFVYKTGAGFNLQADVYRPAESQRRPVILWLHGGALIWGSRTRINPDQVSRYVREGLVVVAIDYRLAPETKLPAILEDLQDAYAWIRREGPTLFQADPSRIVVVGHSAGGYLALMAGTVLTPPPIALVSFYGYGDISAPWGNQPDAYYSRQSPVSKETASAAVGSAVLTEASSERWPFYLYCRQQGRWAREVAGDQVRDERYCPMRRVTPAFPPTLLLHGDQDTDVPFEQSVQMAEALRRKGVPRELITLTDRGHAFDSLGDGMADPRVAEAFDRVVAFIKGRVAR